MTKIHIFEIEALLKSKGFEHYISLGDFSEYKTQHKKSFYIVQCNFNKNFLESADFFKSENNKIVKKKEFSFLTKVMFEIVLTNFMKSDIDEFEKFYDEAVL